ncbi:hypothetical protein [Corynebacterium sphenisci]|uniref:hypothetical protein n=1 Tax=Corynebacterium sphenisci TaxID=191493 RepID=UPI0026E0735B|nr:hypothetical protein [Corynebacterium sphenisci]MDO5731725.1 hypothetical protein [Corynebacterium sphenisci]
MTTIRHQRLAAALAAAALLTAACQDAPDEVEVPDFTVEESTGAEAPAGSTTSGTASESGQADDGRPGDGDDASEDDPGSGGSRMAALDNGDGSYRLSRKPPSNDAPDEVIATFNDVEEYGFSAIKFTLAEDNQTAFLSYPTGEYGPKLYWTAYALNGDVRDDACPSEMRVLDANGVDVTGEALSFGVYKTTDLRDENCKSSFSPVLEEGIDEFVIEFTIRQKGFDPIIIRQPVRGMN